MSKSKIRFITSPAGNPAIEFDYVLSKEEEEALSNYLNGIQRMERERIIKLLEEELGEGDWVITLIKGESND